jgi:thioredoxin-related protein
MRKISFTLFILCLLSLPCSLGAQNWIKSWDEARQTAQNKHKNILLNFSGSDWCIPCMKMHKRVFGSSEFVSYADQNLILYNADFPRSSKNRLTKELAAQNDHLADQYNKEGHFPFTVLLTPDGKILKQWNGLYTKSIQEFIAEIRAF